MSFSRGNAADLEILAEEDAPPEGTNNNYSAHGEWIQFARTAARSLTFKSMHIIINIKHTYLTPPNKISLICKRLRLIRL